MTALLEAALIALFAWWFSTGAVFWAVSRGGAVPGIRVVAYTLPLAALAVHGLMVAADMPGARGAYLGFAAAIVLWGWIELTFLAGVITGPNTLPCPPGARGWRRFLLAWGTIAHHELALLLTAIGLGAMAWEAPNTTGLWTFLLLFGARISAKLNVYLGVPNFSDEMLPRPMGHLKTYFAKRPMNLLFPVSITLLTFAAACWAERAYAAPPGSGAEVGFVLLATLTTLAIVEHWLMVLPVRDALLWQWMARKHDLPPGTAPGPAD